MDDDIVNINDIHIARYNIVGSSSFNYKKLPYVFNTEIRRNEDIYDINSNIFKDKILLSLNDELELYFDVYQKLLTVKSNNLKIPIFKKYINLTSDFIFDMKNNTIQENEFKVDNVEIFNGEIGTVKSKMRFENGKFSFDDFIQK